MNKPKTIINLTRKIFFDSLRINEDDFEIHIARAVGNRLEDFLREAKKRLWVISPWISDQYANLLVNKRKKGVNVQLVTTLDHINSDAFKSLIGQKKKNKEKDVLGGLITKSETTTYFVSRLGGENLVVFEKQEGRYRKMRFTHSKIYIADNMAALGSANLTENGLWNNVETLWICDKKSVVKKICKAFQKIKDHPMLDKASINEVAQYAHIPEEEIERKESELDKLDRKLQEKANEVISDIFG